ncbi:MAG TPA: hypothetical protein VF165_17505 [Nocardioidaceae bacterium]
MGVDDRVPRQPAENNEESPGDYSYDMAHDVAATAHPARLSTQGARPGRHGSGETPPPDEAGDYSYDLAHEVPPAKE